MSKTKEFYHDEICRGLGKMDDEETAKKTEIKIEPIIDRSDLNVCDFGVRRTFSSCKISDLANKPGLAKDNSEAMKEIAKNLGVEYKDLREEITNTCDGYQTSNCCGDRFLSVGDGEETDVCLGCGEHAAPSCHDCEEPCQNKREE